jgi:hypothetical protein
MLHRVQTVETQPGYRVWIRFDDGAACEVDLSDLAGKGVFQSWADPSGFEKVFIDEKTGTLPWPGGIDLAPDALYQDVAGATSRQRS